MNRTALLLLSFIAATALAQEGLTRGDSLRRREFRTFSATTLFVDSTGNDSNACTSSGTAACLTINGALSKLPKIIQNNVTINVAAGTYAGFTVSNFIGVAPSSAQVTFTVVGAMANFTPTTGTATGTLTTAATNLNGLGTLTDSGQAWTVDDLVGRFVRITSGAQSGQRRAILGNTATALEVVGLWGTVPASGVTYVIESPSVTINSLITISGNTGPTTILLDSLETTSAVNVSCSNQNVPVFSPRSLRMRNTAGTSLSVSACSYAGTGATVGASAVVAITTSAASAFTLSSAVDSSSFRSNSNGLLVIQESTSTANPVAVLNAVASNTWTSLSARSFSATGSTLFRVGFSGYARNNGGFDTSYVVRCANTGQTGFDISGSGVFLDPVSTVTRADTCGLGIAYSGSVYAGVRPVCNSTPTCLSVSEYAHVFLTAVPVLSGVSVDYSIGSISYSDATVTALSPRRVQSSTGASLERP